MNGHLKLNKYKAKFSQQTLWESKLWLVGKSEMFEQKMFKNVRTWYGMTQLI